MRLIAHRDREEFTILKDCPKTGHKKQRFIFAKAWERLDRYTGQTQDGRPQPVVEDVDKQALSLLEDAMFLPDLNPGPPGQQQWGLDVGIHQDNWDPYVQFPDHQGRVYHVWENEDFGENYKHDAYTESWKRDKQAAANADVSTRRTRPRPTPVSVRRT
ncbi:hypothetical protein PQX77_008812 [Marasmius sp. AFHP31]|nr:hypothetical protein PQX77_008812 [Marasmius sp. AFHP31]